MGDRLATLVRTGDGLARILGDADPEAVWLASLVRDGLDPAEVPHLDLRGLAAAWDALATTPAERLRWHHGWPAAFADRTLDQLGAEEALAFAAASDQRAPLDLRVNAARGPVERAIAALAEDGVTARALGGRALRVESGRGVEASRAFREGLVEIQDAGSQRLGDLVGGDPADVLDLCAGAGGKSLQLADLGHRVVACDPRAAALDELGARAARAGVRVERHVGGDGDATALRGRRFDVVLVDAPCTGTGTWRRNPALRWSWTPEAEDRAAARQRRLLDRAVAFLRPGGRLIYGTCAVGRAEDEDVVAAFVADHPAAELAATLRTWPHRDGTDGFFGAALALPGGARRGG